MESAGARLNLVLLDACRNNPFGGRGLRSTNSGLAQMQAPEGTLLSFATQPGNVARDGNGHNSPYTEALAKTIRRPGLDIFRTFNEVGVEVANATGGTQQPWVSLSPIKGEFYFAGREATAQRPQDPAASAWAAAQGSSDAQVLETFIYDFGETVYGALARARLEELKTSQVAAVEQPIASATASGQPEMLLSADRERTLSPKDVFKDCANCPSMIVVPGGNFTMGSPDSEKGRDKAEGPRHQVRIDQPFAVGQFEITVEQFAQFVLDTDYFTGTRCHTFENGKFDEKQGRTVAGPGFPQTRTHPATCINWDDAKAYVSWLSRKTGKTYRLLSEAEWEYVARAGTTTRYYFGDDTGAMCRNGNGADKKAKETIPETKDWSFFSCDDGYAYSSPVGSFTANPFGLYDILGNVTEWTEDCYHGNYVGAPADGSAWISAGCYRHVLRGGAWYWDPDNFRSATRFEASSNKGRYSEAGLRIARTLNR
jgi:formylglycine-generating enzyme required for sulfatase activity